MVLLLVEKSKLVRVRSDRLQKKFDHSVYILHGLRVTASGKRAINNTENVLGTHTYTCTRICMQAHTHTHTHTYQGKGKDNNNILYSSQREIKAVIYSYTLTHYYELIFT